MQDPLECRECTLEEGRELTFRFSSSRGQSGAGLAVGIKALWEGACGSVRELVETCRALLLKGEARDVVIA